LSSEEAILAVNERAAAEEKTNANRGVITAWNESKGAILGDEKLSSEEVEKRVEAKVEEQVKIVRDLYRKRVDFLLQVTSNAITARRWNL
jgi:hypothetical protein